ncbi:phage integrase family protein [Cupriavidus gilardii]|uniref:phage integrase family protein n=2 Tax=Cupriavidus gilardii TaxID=82541 RepID=UPI003CC7EBFE
MPEEPMKTILDEAVSHLGRASYAALSAWLQGVPADRVAARWLMPADAETMPTLRQSSLALGQLLKAARLQALRHGHVAIGEALQPKRWTRKTRQCAIDALHRIEAFGPVVPQPGHDIALWMSPPVVVRLRRSGVQTLGDLIALLDRYGNCWSRHVSGIGMASAGRIGAFVNRHATTLRCPAALVAGDRARQPVTAVGTLLGSWMGTDLPHAAPSTIQRKLGAVHAAPASHGIASESPCLSSRGQAVPTRGDDVAVQSWLSYWPPGTATRRAYAREAARFVAWIALERGKTLASVLPSDCVAYSNFLSTLSPHSKWCGPRVCRIKYVDGQAVSNAAWRPFTGSLSPRSRAYTEQVLRLMFEWLKQQHYVGANPWVGICHTMPTLPRRLDQPVSEVPVRFWKALHQWFDSEARRSATGRLARAAFLLLSETGLSSAEATRASIRTTDSPEGGREVWTIEVKRADESVGVTTVTPRLRDAIRAHWRDRDDSLASIIGYPRGIPLPGKVRPAVAQGCCGYSVRGLRHVLKRALHAFSDSISSGDHAMRRWAAQLHADSLSHGAVATSLPESLRDQGCPMYAVSRHRRGPATQRRRTLWSVAVDNGLQPESPQPCRPAV